MKHKNKKETFLSALYVISIIIAVCILVNSIAVKQREFLALSLCYLCFCLWNYHNEKLDDNKNLYRKVAWIAEREKYGKFSGSSVSLRELELVEHIEIEQNQLNIPDKFRINFLNEEEKEHLTKILNHHKEHVLEYYFSDWLATSKDIYKLSSLEYYFFSLNSFVDDNLSGYKIDEAYANREKISDCEFKYHLTNYGKVYYKLHLITQLYIEENENIQKLYEYINKEKTKHIMEVLENNEVVFLSYRP